MFAGLGIQYLKADEQLCLGRQEMASIFSKVVDCEQEMLKIGCLPLRYDCYRTKHPAPIILGDRSVWMCWHLSCLSQGRHDLSCSNNGSDG